MFLSFSTGTYENKCSEFWIPLRSALHDSQSTFLQRFQKVLLVLLLFDIVLCLIQETVIFLFNFPTGSQKYFQNFFMIIVTIAKSSYHFGFMHETDTLFEHMQSYRISVNKTSKKFNGVVPSINSSEKYIARLTCHEII